MDNKKEMINKIIEVLNRNYQNQRGIIRQLKPIQEIANQLLALLEAEQQIDISATQVKQAEVLNKKHRGRPKKNKV